jgi:hypothetical protein
MREFLRGFFGGQALRVLHSSTGNRSIFLRAVFNFQFGMPASQFLH